MKFKLLIAFVVGFGLFLAQTVIAASLRIESAVGISVRLDETSGRYEIASRQPDWKFAGELGGPAKETEVSHGTDRIGAYQEIHFSWQAGALMTGSIRVYDQRVVVLFTLACDQPADKWTAIFPRFTSIPAKLHHFSGFCSIIGRTLS